MTGEFTGRHMTAILVGFFGVVIAVNFTMAFYASSTFGGLVVENSYVASQEFNGWLRKARTERAQGLEIGLARAPDDRLAATLKGPDGPVGNAEVSALARHPLGRIPERLLRFRSIGEGRYQSVDVLPAGRWIVHLRASEQGRQVNRIIDLQ